MKVIVNNQNEFEIFDMDSIIEKDKLSKKISEFLVIMKKIYGYDISGIYHVCIYNSIMGNVYKFKRTDSFYSDEVEFKIDILKNEILFEFDDYFDISNKHNVYTYNNKYYKYEIDITDTDFVTYIYGSQKDFIESKMTLLKQ